MESTQYVLNKLRQGITEYNLQLRAIIQVNIHVNIYQIRQP